MGRTIQQSAALNALIVSGTAARSLDYAASGAGKAPSSTAVAALTGYGLVDKLDATAFSGLQQRAAETERQIGENAGLVTAAEQAVTAFKARAAKASAILDYVFPVRVRRRAEELGVLTKAVEDLKAKKPAPDAEANSWKAVEGGAIRVNAFGAAYRRWIEATGNVPQPFQAPEDKSGLNAACAGVAAALPKCSPYVCALIAGAAISAQEAVDASEGLAPSADASALLMLAAVDRGATAGDMRSAFVRASESPIARQFGADVAFLMLDAALKSGKDFQVVEGVFEEMMSSGLRGAELRARSAHQTATSRFEGSQEELNGLDALAQEAKVRSVSVDDLRRDADMARPFCASATAAEMLAIVASRAGRPVADIAIFAETLRPTPSKGVDTGAVLLAALVLELPHVEDLVLIATTSSVEKLAKAHRDAISPAAGPRSQLDAGVALLQEVKALSIDDATALLSSLPSGQDWGEQNGTSKAIEIVNRVVGKGWGTKLEFAPRDREIIFQTAERVRSATPSQKEALLTLAVDALAKSYKWAPYDNKFKKDAVATLKQLIDAIPSNVAAASEVEPVK